MLDAIESRFSTQYRTPTPIVGAQGNSAISITARPIVSGAVPASSTPPISGVPVLPIESPIDNGISFWLDPVEAPIKPATPVTAPSASGVLSDGSAGVQVTSGISGSHDAVGINSSVISSLASIGDSSSVLTAPMDSPHDTGSGTWIMVGLGVIAVWFLLR